MLSRPSTSSSAWRQAVARINAAFAELYEMHMGCVVVPERDASRQIILQVGHTMLIIHPSLRSLIPGRR